MKKLIGFFAVCFFVCSPLLAEEWKNAIYDNIVNDIWLTDDKVYTATNGGIEIFWKDTSKLFENGLPWKIYQRFGNSEGTVSGILKKVFVNDVVSVSGRIFAINGDWLTVSGTVENHLNSVPLLNGKDLAVSSKGVVYGVAEDGLFSVNPDGTRESIPLSFGVTKIAFDCHGTLWGIFEDGIVFSLDTAGVSNTWRCDKELTLGVPNNITVRNDTVVVTAEKGIYVKFGLADWQQESWLDAVNADYYLSRKLPIPVAISKGCINIGNVNNVAFWEPKQPFAWCGGFFPGNFNGFSVINCLAADDKNLYIGTDNKMWVSYGGCFLGQWPSQKSVTGIHYPHDNNIKFIASMHGATDYTDRILVSTNSCGMSGGGYYYKNNADAPMLEGSNYVNGGEIKSLFVEKNGWYWVGKKSTLVRVNKLNQEWIKFPISIIIDDYWLVGDINNNPWIVISSHRSSSIWSYAGDNTWANQLNAPENLANQKILSVSSTGKFVWIATDSAVYSYDFRGVWTYQKLSYSENRKICGNNSEVFCNALIVEGSAAYMVGDQSTTLWPCGWFNCQILDVVKSGNTFWVATDSGVYYREGVKEWQAVPLKHLADDHVNTVYVDSATNTVWFGTAGGLTVWHRDSPIKINPTFKSNSLFKNRLSFNSGNIRLDLDKPGMVSLKLYDLRGRVVATPINGNKNAGSYSISLRDKRLGRGNYLCVLQTQNLKQILRVNIL